MMLSTLTEWHRARDVARALQQRRRNATSKQCTAGRWVDAIVELNVVSLSCSGE
jgi:hypothetical protein